MGKTAFALNILKNMAVDQKKSVALFSLEMSSDQIADRVLSMVSGFIASILVSMTNCASLYMIEIIYFTILYNIICLYW